MTRLATTATTTTALDLSASSSTTITLLSSSTGKTRLKALTRTLPLVRSQSELRFASTANFNVPSDDDTQPAMTTSRNQWSRTSVIYKPLQQVTLNAYERNFGPFRAEQVWHDAQTFTAKSWLGRVQMAKKMSRCSVESRFRQPFAQQPTSHHQQQPKPKPKPRQQLLPSKKNISVRT